MLGTLFFIDSYQNILITGILQFEYLFDDRYIFFTMTKSDTFLSVAKK
jgi:hypothetical protein